MKIALRNEKGVSILTASQSITESDAAVLAAGVRKLLRDGKNRIVIHLPEISKVPIEVIRVLAQLNLAAAELAGQIRLSGLDPVAQQQIRSFSTPPALFCYATEAEAIAAFAPPRTEEPLDLAPKTAQPGEYKAEIRERELGELGELRKRLQDAEKEVRELSRLLAERIFAARLPDSEEKTAKKIQALEAELSEAQKKIDSARA